MRFTPVASSNPVGCGFDRRASRTPESYPASRVNKVTVASDFPLGGDQLAWLDLTETQDMHYLTEKVSGCVRRGVILHRGGQPARDVAGTCLTDEARETRIH